MKYIGQTDDFVLTEENYYTPEANAHYLSIHDFIEHIGSVGQMGCEARGEAKRDGIYDEEKSTALMVGSYVDSYFEGTLDAFKKQHPEILTQKGELRSEYKRADKMIQRATRDEKFMKYMTGEKQKILTGYFAGLWWKIKIDNLMYDKEGNPLAIVDLKTNGKPLNYSWNVQDLGRVGFVEYWGYDLQMALYQKIAEINGLTKGGQPLPTYIACITKEEEPDIAIIGLQEASGGNMMLNNSLKYIEDNAEQFKMLVSKEIEPIRCNRADCMYCRSTKKIDKPIFYQDLIMY